MQLTPYYLRRMMRLASLDLNRLQHNHAIHRRLEMEGLQQGDHTVLVFLNIDIVNSSKLSGSGAERSELFNDFADYIERKISDHNGHKVNWGKDGGIFLFGVPANKE